MTFPHFHYNPNQEPPFTVFIAHRDKESKGYWRPDAFVMLTKSLRTSEFLFALPPDDFKSFLLLLTFLTPNGHCAPALSQLAAALHLSQAKTRSRMQRLVTVRWHDQPIVLAQRSGSGSETYALAPGLLPVREEEPQPAQVPVLRAAPRGAVIEHSRRTYARPRAEVEREIARLNNWKLPEDTKAGGESELVEDTPQAALQRELMSVGLLKEQAEELVSRYDEIRIRRQLMWLPYRAVRKPAGFLMAAVKDDYAAPLNMPRSIAASPIAPVDGTAENKPAFKSHEQ